jgi:hypothetical protein
LLFTNNGSVIVENGTLEFQNLVNGAGRFTIDAGAALQFDTVAKGSSVDFATTTGGDLTLLDSSRFSATIRGFGGPNTDTIDLRDLDFTSPDFTMIYRQTSATGGVLTVSDGMGHTAALDFFGKYKTVDFHASNDGLNGALIVDPAHATLVASTR